ncbi:GNAT family N-acetyltransferase [Natronoglycomyces albus]|uniref:GNAT family N-acetyltransferase n=1 Tax=Natronoglycomyces albus TaxID=2811108 RepID=A0A895XPY4_9ACTN|nr:GNAT family protein [Natronoglycomyces albus]QSB05603.1 GNAT family N-acetyltransferase [Natronoglycomyces albus]
MANVSTTDDFRPDFYRKPTLSGDLVTLVPLGADYGEQLFHALNDPEVARLTGSRGSFELKKLMPIIAARRFADDRLDLAVIDNATQKVVGEVVLNEWEPENRSCNYRIALGPQGQGRGLGTEAGCLIIDYGFQKLRLNRISLGVYAFNPRGIRSYEKIGFVVEGRQRQALLWDGEYVDHVIMSLLAEEWRPRR